MSNTYDPERAAELATWSSAELSDELDKLVEVGEPALALLQELAAAEIGKANRKLVRRALHRLRTRGISAPPVSTESRGGGVLRPIPGFAEQGVVTPIDPAGRRGLFLVAPVSSEIELTEIGLSDRDGVLGVRSRGVRRRDARSFLRELPVNTAVVPGDQVRALVAKALLVQAEWPASLDRGAVEALARGAGETPGQLLLNATPALERPAPERIEAKLQELMEAGPLIPWPPLGAPLQDLAQKLKGLESSPLVLSETQRAEQRRELVQGAAAAIYDPPCLACMAERLLETGVLVEAAGDEEGAVCLVALARELGGSPPDPLAIPFMQKALDLALEVVTHELDQEASEKLIVP